MLDDKTSIASDAGLVEVMTSSLKEAASRIAALESSLAERERECERLRETGLREREEYNVMLHDLHVELASLRARDEGRVERERKEVAWFAEQMERKLKMNDHKSHWTNCDPVWLFERLEEEATELHAAFRPTHPIGCFADTPKDAERIIDEAADVANFAMMIADKARSVLAAADGEPRGE